MKSWEELIPTQQEQRVAGESAEILHDILAIEKARLKKEIAKTQKATKELVKLRINITDATQEVHEINIPLKALGLLNYILTRMSKGETINVYPIQAEITTQQAADLLGVSRVHLVKNLLAEKGDDDYANKIPYTQPGKHRKIRLRDLFAYKDRIGKERDEALSRLSKQNKRLAEELGDEIL